MTKNKLSIKLAVWIVGVSTLLTIISSLFHLKYEYNKKIENFNVYIESIKKNNERILRLSLWHYDLEAVRSILEDIVDTRAVKFAKIVLSDKTVFVKGEFKDVNVLEKKFIFRQESGGHIYKIGNLTIQGDLNYVKNQIKDKAFRMVFSEFLKVILMSIFILYLIQQLFITKLSRLATYAKTLHIDNLDEKIGIRIPKNEKYYDELDVVVSSFNVMRNNLLVEISNSNSIKQELVSFRQAVEQSYNSIVITDTKRRIVYVNEVFEKITGYKKEEVLGKNPNILKPNNSHALYYKNMNKTLNEGKIWKGELVNIKKDGSYFYEQASIIPIYINNELINYLAIKLDITDYKESLLKINQLNTQLEKKVKVRTQELEFKNEELNDSINSLEATKNRLEETEKIANSARKQAENANREKSMFLANVSHELKTPLNGISGLVYLTQLKTMNKEILGNLTSINNYSETLLRMIGDLLDVSKLDAKKIEIVNIPFDLVQMLKSMNEIYAYECNKKDILFNFRCCETIPNKIVGDSIRLHQVITNLLNNAIKFTKTFVKLNVICDQVTDNSVKLTFEVEDDGIGIKEEDLNTIFDAFYQTKESLNYYAGGSGLGLNICKNIIQQMDGLIHVKSKLNKGSHFSISLSFEIFQEDEIETSFVKAEDENYVLIVDDNNINLEVMEGILNSVNVKSVLAKNGQEALSLFNKYNFDLVITDIKMPIMDGCQLSKKIREKYSKEELPIIIVSANERNHFDDCQHKFSVNDYIQKPIDPKSFIQILSFYIKLNKLDNENKTIATPDSEILDVNDALNRFVNNEELFKKSLKEFLNELLNSSYKIDKYLFFKQNQELTDYLHMIKGLSGNLSAKKLTRVATQFHDAMKYSRNFESIYSKYKKEIETIEVSINNYLNEEEGVKILLSSENKNNEELNSHLYELLKLTKSFSTKSLKYFELIPIEVQDNIFLDEIKSDILNYKFKDASSKIETYLENSMTYSI